MAVLVRILPNAIAFLMSAIFLDSLRFKFTNHPNTQEIFGRLDAWSGSLGAPGLFAQSGIFSQYTIGTAELAASLLLLAGIAPRFAHLQALGATLAVAIMAAAVSFHVFTPLGTDPNNDGGGLFVAACLNLAAGLSLLMVFRRKEALILLRRLGGAFGPL